MEMHAIQSKQASMSSGCIVGNSYPGITSGLPVARPNRLDFLRVLDSRCKIDSEKVLVIGEGHS